MITTKNPRVRFCFSLCLQHVFILNQAVNLFLSIVRGQIMLVVHDSFVALILGDLRTIAPRALPF